MNIEQAFASSWKEQVRIAFKYEFGDDQWWAVEKLFDGESGWNPYAKNKSSGAYGICQSLPAEKMASAGDDYLTNPLTQAKWCIGYIKNRYENPEKAYNFWLAQAPHWY